MYKSVTGLFGFRVTLVAAAILAAVYQRPAEADLFDLGNNRQLSRHDPAPGVSYEGMLLAESNIDGDLTGVDLTDSTIHANAQYATSFGAGTGLTALQIRSTASYGARTLQSASFRTVDITGMDLSNFNLDGTDFGYRTTVTNVDFSGATIHSVMPSDYRGHRLRGASFDEVIGLSEAQFRSTASYQAGTLRGVFFWDMDLSGWDLSDQNLEGVGFFGCTLTGVDFTDATIHSINASGSGYFLTGAAMNDTVGLTESQLRSTASYKAGTLRGVEFLDQDMSGWDLSNQNLEGAWLKNCTLTGTDFTGATIHVADTDPDGG